MEGLQMPCSPTQRHAHRLFEQLPSLPEDMHGNDGRERARHAFVVRTLNRLRTGGAVTGDRAEDWRRVARQLGMLWQMGRDRDYRLTVAGLQLIALEAEPLEPAPAGPVRGAGPHGGDLIFAWHAAEGDWISVPGKVAGPLVETSMGMPDLEGVAGTVLLIDQRHRFRPGGPPDADVLIDAAERIERLDAEVERARASQQWERDCREQRGR
ncbi:hypothetical protein ACFV3R_10980 [Streptomyces sp. NPDC059740]|uniref:hypothetical protein n=1 Tax=Streptomyces sp. NPDC059740 TaxID=3346926 RepID=UPI0036664E19